MNWIDFHCHLDAEDFSATRENIVNECIQVGFKKLVTVADPYLPESLEISLELLSQFPGLYSMAGAHPHEASSYNGTVEGRIIEFSSREKVIGLGEVGLDFHYNFSAKADQLRVFKRQIALAAELELPLIIHSRLAEKEILECLDGNGFLGPVIFHCYTGNLSDAVEILKRGYFISISGIITFKKADDLREVVRRIPLERLFVETDSPYLSPEPFRGKTNTPLRVQLVAERVARLKGVEVSELNRYVLGNFQTLFER